MMPRRRACALSLLLCLSLALPSCVVRRRLITRKGAKAAPVLFVAPSPEPVKFLVNPDDVKAAVVAAVSETAKAEVNRLTGRLD